MITTQQLEDIWFTVTTVFVKEYDEDGELLFTLRKPFSSMQDASDYATEYHKGRIAYPGGSYQLIFTRK